MLGVPGAMGRAGADGLHAAGGDALPGHHPGGGRHQPRGGVPDGAGALAGRHRGHGLLELAGPRRAAQLAAAGTHLQRQTLRHIQDIKFEKAS